MIDDIIRKQRMNHFRKGNINLKLFWGKEGYKQLKNYISSFAGMLDNLNIDEYINNQPVRLLGVDNYYDKTKKGLLLKVENK